MRDGHWPGDRAASRRGAAAWGLAGGVAAGAATTLGLSAYLMRRLVTPERDQAENVRILAVDADTLTLDRTEDSIVPGRYGLWLYGGRGHARVGQILAEDPAAGTVTRVLEGVDAGRLHPGPARWNGYYHGGDPRQSLGLDFEHVTIPGPVGALPAWLVPAGDRSRWAILVHGRGALRGECLRAVPVLHRLGITSLVVGYRNDADAPSSGDRRYALGLAEWADIDAALAWTHHRGARSVSLLGWSMGGAIVLQTLARSALAGRLVDAVVLDAPVVDWGDVIRHHVRLGRLPVWLAQIATRVLRSTGARRLVGVESPLDVAQTDWTTRAGEVRHPILLIHSVDDEFVPVGPSLEFARRAPQWVRYERWTTALHTKEWNTDPDRWERLVAEFLAEHTKLRD